MFIALYKVKVKVDITVEIALTDSSSNLGAYGPRRADFIVRAHSARPAFEEHVLWFCGVVVCALGKFRTRENAKVKTTII